MEIIDKPTLESLKMIARNAGAAILSVYAQEDLGVERKADESPLTLADKASNEVICSGLEQMDVKYPIISEENKDIPYKQREVYSRFWLVDPLDGTKEFIKRNGEFTVNIALIEDQAPVAGVVYVPVTRVLYYAVKGQGSFIEENGVTRQLQVEEFEMSAPGLGVVCSRSHLNDETKAFIDKLNDPQTISKGSSLKFLILAEGGAHLYPRIAPTMEWDTAAAQCVLEQAGGVVLEYESRTPLKYNKESLLNPHFLAAGRVKHS